MAWFTFALFVAYVLGFATRPLLRRLGAYDMPNQRSSHQTPTLRGGGVAIVGAMLVCSCCASVVTNIPMNGWVLATAFGISLISFIDDLRPLPAALRFGCHAGMAVVAIAVLFPSGEITQSASTLMVVSVVLLWITGYTNVFNFMDGINGIAAGQAVVTGIGMAVVHGTLTGVWLSGGGFLAIIAAGAAAGFLPHNFPEARMFMGDVGSATLGYVLAVAACWMVFSAGFEIAAWLLILHLNFLLDAGFTLLRRVLRGEKWYSAHREHFYQRWVRAGKSHSFVTGSYIGIQVLVTASVWSGVAAGWPWWIVALAAAACWGLLFWRAETAFHAAQLPAASSAGASRV